MENEPERWERIGEHVRGRMEELAMNQADLIRASGLSDMTLRPIIDGEVVRSRAATLAKVARGLRWESDAFSRMLAGGDPIPLPDEPDQSPPWEQLLAGQRELSDRLEQIAALLERGD